MKCRVVWWGDEIDLEIELEIEIKIEIEICCMVANGWEKNKKWPRSPTAKRDGNNNCNDISFRKNLFLAGDPPPAL